MSSRAGVLGVALLASLLLLTVLFELRDVGPGEDEGGIVAIRHPPRAAPRAPAEEAEDRTDAWVRVALARPLFSRDRRPTPAEAKPDGGSAMATLPRLTGVIVGPFGRTAIFAAAGGGKPIALTKGQTLGPFTVEAIEPGGITVSGPDGERRVTLMPDAETRKTLAAEIPREPAQVPGLQTLPPGAPPGTLPMRGMLGVPDPPLTAPQRQNLLNLRPGLPMQRGQPVVPGLPPNQEGSN